MPSPSCRPTRTVPSGTRRGSGMDIRYTSKPYRIDGNPREGMDEDAEASSPLSLDDLCRAIVRDYNVTVGVRVWPQAFPSASPMTPYVSEHIVNASSWADDRDIMIDTDGSASGQEIWDALTESQREYVSYTLLHELGHILDGKGGIPRLT